MRADHTEQIVDRSGSSGIVDRRIPRAVGQETDQRKNDKEKKNNAGYFFAHTIVVIGYWLFEPPRE